MAVTYLSNRYAHSGCSTDPAIHTLVGGVHTFKQCPLGPASATRRFLIGIIANSIGYVGIPTGSIVSVNGVAASQIFAATAYLTRIGYWRVVVPDDETGEVVITFNRAQWVHFGMWAVTNASELTYHTHSVEQLSQAIIPDGPIMVRDRTIGSVPGGFTVGLMIGRDINGSDAARFTAGFTTDYSEQDGAELSGACSQFRTGPFYRFRTVGVHAVTTETSLAYSFRTYSNWNCVNLVMSLTEGGAEDAPSFFASLETTINVSLSNAEGEQPLPCPIPGLGSEACIVGRTAVPPGNGQIVCGQATYIDPCV